MRQLVTNNTQKLINKQNAQTERRQTSQQKLETHERKLTYNIKKKTEQNQLVVTKVDKGSTLVILRKED
jgi:hypothetical protein